MRFESCNMAGEGLLGVKREVILTGPTLPCASGSYERDGLRLRRSFCIS